MFKMRHHFARRNLVSSPASCDFASEPSRGAKNMRQMQNPTAHKSPALGGLRGNADP